MKRRTFTAVVFTIAYLAIVALIVWSRECELFELPLNSLGDFLAGAFGPLALAWLIFGYFQQGDELQNGTAALKLQGVELKNSVEQQQRLAEISLQALELERQEREEEKLKYRHGLLPIFHLESVDLKFEGESYTGFFRLFNDGAQVYSLTSTFVKGGDWNQCASFRMLDRGESKDFTAQWSIHSPDNYFLIDVVYVMKDSVKGLARFKSISAGSDGVYSKLIEFTREDIILP